YWAEEYHIDGFRFDLMALHDKVTMQKIEKTLHAIDPSILIYGEPWMGGLSPLDPSQQMVKGAQKDMKIAVFNDNFRNAIKGDNDGIEPGFVSGAYHREDDIKRGVVGSIYYNELIQDFTAQPAEAVNYVSSHDNLTLWDKLAKSNGDDSEKLRIKMDRLAQGIILTSQGIPFLQGGEDLLRTKWGNHNSYNAGDKVNQLKWERKAKYYQTFKYYQGLIKLRKEHPGFRMINSDQIRKHLDFLEVPPNTVGFIIKEHANDDKWKNIIVFYNPNKEDITYKLPSESTWNVVVNSRQAGINTISRVIDSNEVTLEAVSLMVLYEK
ncbi:MAG: alpha-1,6-glucosidase domain-containing protein, partial [Halothermotrichaceae bacterium]